MLKKNETPLKVLKDLECFAGLKGENFTITTPNDVILKATYNDPESDFFFIIDRYITVLNGKGYHYDLLMRPYSDMKISTETATVSDIKKHFDNWVNFINGYANVKFISDDPILNNFKQQILEEIKVPETEADKPLSLDHILLLDTSLQEYSHRLEEMANDTNREQINQVREDISQLQEQLTTNTKKTISEKLATIFAKTSKLGVKFIRDFHEAGKKEIYKQIFVGTVKLLNNGHDIGHTIDTVVTHILK